METKLETQVVTIKFREKEECEIIRDVISTVMDASALTIRLDGETIVFPIGVIFRVSVTKQRD